MFKTPEEASAEADRNFQMKLKKFKKNWIASLHGRMSHQNQIVLKDTPRERKTQATIKPLIKSSGKRVRRKPSINPGDILKKKAQSFRFSLEKFEKSFGQDSIFADKSKVNKTGMNLDTPKKTSCSQANCDQTLKQKKKYRRKRSEYREKSLKFRNDEYYENSSSSESSNVKVSKSNTLNALKNHTSLKDDCTTSKNENTSSKNSQQQSKFRLRSPILFRNADKPEPTNKFAQSSVTITTDTEMESSGFTSSNGSFSFQKFEWGSHSVRSRKIQDHRQNSDSWRNYDSGTSFNPIHDQRSENQHRNVVSWLWSLKNQESDISKLSDDSENSVTFSLKYKERVAANGLVEKNYTRNIEMEMNTSAALGTKLQNFTDRSSHNKDRRSNFSPDCVGKLGNLSPSLNQGKSLLSRKRSMQWYNMPDSLESSLSTSKEKLNEIKDLF